MTSMLCGSKQIQSEMKDYSRFKDEFREVEYKIMALLVAPNIFDFLPMLSWFNLQGFKREMKKQFEYLDRILDTIIKERIEETSSKIKGMDVVEEDEKKDFLCKYFSTGTTSMMVEWVMTEILNNPGVMKKVHDELTEVIGMKIVEESDLPKLTYLDAVDTQFQMNVWAIHRDPENWSNPLEFNPERFLDNKWDYTGGNFKFLPFGSGRRICPRILLGEKMLMYIIASLLHSFEWHLPKDEELELSDLFGLVIKKKNPLIAIPSKRLSDASLY
ncbi:cytochrome P450 76C1-like protein [Tanacetum coccineum]